eukprot:65327-Amphidinium_carterae.1
MALIYCDLDGANHYGLQSSFLRLDTLSDSVHLLQPSYRTQTTSALLNSERVPVKNVRPTSQCARHPCWTNSITSSLCKDTRKAIFAPQGVGKRMPSKPQQETL